MSILRLIHFSLMLLNVPPHGFMPIPLFNLPIFNLILLQHLKEHLIAAYLHRLKLPIIPLIIDIFNHSQALLSLENELLNKSTAIIAKKDTHSHDHMGRPSSLTVQAIFIVGVLPRFEEEVLQFWGLRELGRAEPFHVRLQFQEDVYVVGFTVGR